MFSWYLRHSLCGWVPINRRIVPNGETKQKEKNSCTWKKFVVVGAASFLLYDDARAWDLAGLSDFQ